MVGDSNGDEERRLRRIEHARPEIAVHDAARRATGTRPVTATPLRRSRPPTPKRTPSAAVGDWNGDGVTSVGVFADGQWRLRNALTAGPADISFAYGSPGDLPVVGDWTGTGRDGIGVWNPATAVFSLRTTPTPGPPEITVAYGANGYVPLVGDWFATGRDGIGMWDGANANFHLRAPRSRRGRPT